MGSKVVMKVVFRVFVFPLGRAASRRARAPAAGLYWRARRPNTRKVNICKFVAVSKGADLSVICCVVYVDEAVK